MKKKSKHQMLRRKKEFRFHSVELISDSGKAIRIRHPSYVFLERGNIYIYVTITHSDDIGNGVVLKLRKNPDPTDNRESYRVVGIKEDTKDRFGKRVNGWKMDDCDDQDIRDEYEKR